MLFVLVKLPVVLSFDFISVYITGLINNIIVIKYKFLLNKGSYYGLHHLSIRLFAIPCSSHNVCQARLRFKTLIYPLFCGSVFVSAPRFVLSEPLLINTSRLTTSDIRSNVLTFMRGSVARNNNFDTCTSKDLFKLRGQLLKIMFVRTQLYNGLTK